MWAEELVPASSAGEIAPLPELQVDELEVEVEQKVKEEEKEVINPDTLGIYTSENGGVPFDYWGSRSFEDVLSVLKRIDVDSKSPAYSMFLEKMMLSTTAVPIPVLEGNKGRLFDIRVKKLIKAGRFEEAYELIGTLEKSYSINHYSKEIARMGLVEFNNASVCKTLYEQSQETSKVPFWRITDVICAVNAGEKAGVDYKLEQLKSSNISLPAGLETLIKHAVHGTPIDDNVHIDLNAWSLNLMRLLGYGVEAPENIYSIYVKRGLLMNTGVDSYARVSLAEKMFVNGALPLKNLQAVYVSVAKDYKQELGEAVVTENNEKNGKVVSDTTPLSLQRVKAYQYMLGNVSLHYKIARLQEVYANANTYRDKLETLYIFAPLFKDEVPFKNEIGVQIARMFFAVGQFKVATKWAEKNDNSLWYEMALAERLSTPNNAPEFEENGGVFSVLEGEGEQPKTSTVFGGFFDADDTNNTTTKNTSEVYINQNPLAHNTNKRRVWMNYVNKKYKENMQYSGGNFITQAFLTLEALGYKISDGSWIAVAKDSSLVVQMSLDPAKIRALEILLNNTNDPIEIVLAVRPYVEMPNISDGEFAKILSVLYRAGYGDVAKRIAFERIIYHGW